MVRQRVFPSRRKADTAVSSPPRVVHRLLRDDHACHRKIYYTSWLNGLSWRACCIVGLLFLVWSQNPSTYVEWWNSVLQTASDKGPLLWKESQGVPLSARMPGRNRNLEGRLGKLIQHAEAQARLKGFFTETGASLQRRDRNRSRMKSLNADLAMLHDAVHGRKKKIVLCHGDEDCGRGMCVASRCVCAVGYVGTQCTRPVQLIVEKEEDDIETQRHVVLPLGGTDYFTRRMFGEAQPLYAECNVFYSPKEEENMLDSTSKTFVLYPNPNPVESAPEVVLKEEHEDLILHAYVEHVFGSTGVTEENTQALETLFISLRECVSITMFPGQDTSSVLHKYVLNHLSNALPRGFTIVHR